MFELRYYFNSKNYEVLGTYAQRSLAYGMRKVKAGLPQYPARNLKVIPI